MSLHQRLLCSGKEIRHPYVWWERSWGATGWKTGNECKAKTGFQQGHLVFLFHHTVITISPVGILVQNHMICHAVTSVVILFLLSDQMEEMLVMWFHKLQEMNALSPSVIHEHPCGVKFGYSMYTSHRSFYKSWSLLMWFSNRRHSWHVDGRVPCYLVYDHMINSFSSINSFRVSLNFAWGKRRQLGHMETRTWSHHHQNLSLMSLVYVVC